MSSAVVSMPAVTFTDGRPTRPAPTLTERLASQLVDDVAVLSRPKPPYLIEGRLVAGSLGEIWGEPGTGKTFLMMGCEVALAYTSLHLGAAIPTRGTSLHVVAEGAGSAGERMRAAKLAAGAPLDEIIGAYTLTAAINLTELSHVDALIELAEPMKPALVTIDTLARCMPGADENSAQDMGKVIAACDYIREKTGAAVWLVHHATKTGATERGSGALRGACDTVWKLERVDDLLTLTCEKQKDDEPFDPLELRLLPVPGSDSLAVRLAREVLADRGLTGKDLQALAALQQSFLSSGATKAEWKAASTIPERTFYRAIRRLVDHGYVSDRGQRFVVTGKEPHRDGE